MPDASDRRAKSFRDLGALRLRSFRDGDTHIIVLAGEFDLSATEGVECELKRVEDTDAQFIALDLRGLEFIDSSGVRVIVSAYGREANRLIVVQVSPCVRRVFERCDAVERLPTPMYLSSGRSVAAAARKQPTGTRAKPTSASASVGRAPRLPPD